MQYFKHVGRTWLLAQVLHPLLFGLMLLLCDGALPPVRFALFFSSFIGVLFSLPLLLVAQWLLPLIVRTRASVAMRLMLWGLLLLGGTIVSLAWAVGIFSGFQYSSEWLLFSFPALIAVAAAFAVRGAAFKKLCAAAAPHLALPNAKPDFSNL